MKLSIVTVHKDDFPSLSRTLDSLVRVLANPDFQWIVIDGGSEPLSATDTELFERVTRDADDFVSESDQGIYHAMNKGTSLAAGDYVLYLNAGDELHAAFNFGAINQELQNASPAMVWGVCHERYADGQTVKVKNRSPRLAWYGMPVNHQNVLFRRDLLGNAPYDTSFEMLADYDLIGRLLNQGAAVLRTSMPIAVFQRGGAHSRNLSRTLTEEAQLRTTHFGVPVPVSSAIRLLKHANARLGRVPAIRRIMRRWV